jgi:hypothetical protein
MLPFSIFILLPKHIIEESSRFLKKTAQKFLVRWAMGVVSDNAHGPDS